MKICIEKMGDGTFSVYEEGANAQNNEGDVIGAETPAKTAKSVDEALMMAKGMLGGEMEEMGESPESLLSSGFDQARGMPLKGM